MKIKGKYTHSRKRKHGEADRYNERKLRTLKFFSHHEWLRPAEATRLMRLETNPRSNWSYLKQLHTWQYLRRGRDFHGQIVYRLSKKGANWLLRERGQRV